MPEMQTPSNRAFQQLYKDGNQNPALRERLPWLGISPAAPAELSTPTTASAALLGYLHVSQLAQSTSEPDITTPKKTGTNEEGALRATGEGGKAAIWVCPPHPT